MEIIDRDEPSLDDKLAKPTFWGKVAGFTVQELKPDMFNECLKLIERYLVPEEAMCAALDIKSDHESAAALLANAKDCMRDGTSVVVFKGEDYVEEDAVGAADVADGGGQDLEGLEGLEGGDGAPGAHGHQVDAMDRDAPAPQTVNDTEVRGREREAVEEERGHEEREKRREVQEEDEDEGTQESGISGGEESEDGKEGDKIKKDKQLDGEEEETDEDSDESDETTEDEEMKKRRERKRRRHKRKWAGRKREWQAEGAGSGEGEIEEIRDEHAEDDEGHEEEQRVVAVLVARVVQRLEHMRSFSRVKVVQGDAYQKWLALRCHLQRTANLFEEFGVDSYFRLYHIVVHPDYRRKGVGSFLVRLAARRLADLFARPRPRPGPEGLDAQGQGALCTAVAPSRTAQRLLARQGFRPQFILNYHEWKDEQGQQIVSGAGVGNYNAALVVHQAPARKPDEPADVSPLEDRVEEAAAAAAAEEPAGSESPAMTFLGLGRPPPPQCPPALEEPPFGVAVAASTSRPPTAPTAPTAPSVSLASTGTSGTSGRDNRGGTSGGSGGSGTGSGGRSSSSSV